MGWILTKYLFTLIIWRTGIIVHEHVHRRQTTKYCAHKFKCFHSVVTV